MKRLVPSRTSQKTLDYHRNYYRTKVKPFRHPKSPGVRYACPCCGMYGTLDNLKKVRPLRIRQVIGCNWYDFSAESDPAALLDCKSKYRDALVDKVRLIARMLGIELERVVLVPGADRARSFHRSRISATSSGAAAASGSARSSGMAREYRLG